MEASFRSITGAFAGSCFGRSSGGGRISGAKAPFRRGAYVLFFLSTASTDDESARRLVFLIVIVVVATAGDGER